MPAKQGGPELGVAGMEGSEPATHLPWGNSLSAGFFYRVSTFVPDLCPPLHPLMWLTVDAQHACAVPAANCPLTDPDRHSADGREGSEREGVPWDRQHGSGLTLHVSVCWGHENFTWVSGGVRVALEWGGGASQGWKR